jgi:hypothetical protein
MHRISTVVACVASLCACFEISGLDLLGCEPPESVAQWDMVIGPVSSDIAALAVGDALQLTARVRPLVGGIPDMERGGCHARYGDPVSALILWSSSDDRIASVSATGVVTGRTAGDAIITVQAPFHFVSDALRIRVSIRGSEVCSRSARGSASRLVVPLPPPGHPGALRPLS